MQHVYACTKTPPESIPSAKSHHTPENSNLGHRQGLGQKICNHQISLHILWCNLPILNHIAQPVKAQLNVLESPMMLWIF